MAKHVLLVDDETDFLEVMALRLESRGFEITTADYAAKAMKILEEKPFDAIVMDFQMPGMDGISALKTIRSNHADLKIILLTAYATEDKTDEALAAGASGFLEKPADLSRLARMIEDDQ